MTVEELLARCELVRASETIVTAFSLSNITLSQVLTYNSLFIVICAGTRANIRLSLQKCKGGRIV